MNLVRALQATIRHNGPRPAILDGDRSFTWTEFGGRVARAGALHSLGIRRGARFAILSRNGFRVEELKWAGLWLGAVPVPINVRLAPPRSRTYSGTLPARTSLPRACSSRRSIIRRSAPSVPA